MDSKEEKKKMTKTHKAVLSTLAVLCLLFMGSGVAQAQECFAFPKQCDHGSRRGHDRDGGKTSNCSAGTKQIFGQPTHWPDEVVISITLNTMITNATDSDDVVMGLTYTDGTAANADPALGDADDYRGEDKEVLSDGGTTITWTIATSGQDSINFP